MYPFYNQLPEQYTYFEDLFADCLFLGAVFSPNCGMHRLAFPSWVRAPLFKFTTMTREEQRVLAWVITALADCQNELDKNAHLELHLSSTQSANPQIQRKKRAECKPLDPYRNVGEKSDVMKLAEALFNTPDDDVEQTSNLQAKTRTKKQTGKKSADKPDDPKKKKKKVMSKEGSSKTRKQDLLKEFEDSDEIHSGENSELEY